MTSANLPQRAQRPSAAGWCATVLILVLIGAWEMPQPAAAASADTRRVLVVFHPTPDRIAPAVDRAAWQRARQEATRRCLQAVLPRSAREADPRLLWGAHAVAVTLTPADLAAVRRHPAVADIVPVVYRRWLEPPAETVPPAAFASDTPDFWAVPKTRAPEVWNRLGIDGSGILVGHLDSGIFADHPALQGQVEGFRDFTATGAPVMTPYDDQGHGTHTAGTIAGRTGPMGMAPGARLLAGRVLDTWGGGTNEQIMAAMQWMLDPDGDPATDDAPRVVNNSWGSASTTDRTFWTMVQTWVDAGIVPVFAAGNNGWDNGRVGVPAAFPHAVAVGATDAQDAWAWFSSLGPSTWGGHTYLKPDVVAPGGRVWSAGFQGGFRVLSGTSMAAPHVAGLVALLLQADPRLDVAGITRLLRDTTIDLGPTGPDTKHGYGRIDAFAAVSRALQAVPPTARVTAVLAAGAAGSRERRERMQRGLLRWAATLDAGEWAGLEAGLRAASPAEQRAGRLLALSRQFRRLHSESGREWHP